MVSRSTEIRHLQALSILAQELHFGRAAQRLNVTQPALSQLMRDLETKLGFRVLERTTRKVLLTASGRTFLSEAEAIMRRLDSAIEVAREEAGQAANSIRIGVIVPTTFTFLPEVLTAFRRRYAKADVHIQAGESRHLVRLVEAGTLQIALLRPPGKVGTLKVEVLRREPIIAAMRLDHALASNDTVGMKDFASHRFVRIARMDPQDPFVQIDRLLETVGIDLSDCRAADGALTAMAFVCAGDGVALVPSWIAKLPWKDICFKKVNDLSIGIDLAVIREGASLSPIVEHFIDVARRIAAIV